MLTNLETNTSRGTPYLQPDRHGDGERVHHARQCRALLGDLQEHLADPVVRVLAGGDVALGLPHRERDRPGRTAVRKASADGLARQLDGRSGGLLVRAQRLGHLAVVPVDRDGLQPELPAVHVELFGLPPP